MVKNVMIGYWQHLMPDYFIAEYGFIKGFTPHQIGQLHCLIHEHLQLVIQVFYLCVLDSSRQHVASQVRGLIFAACYCVSQIDGFTYLDYLIRFFFSLIIHCFQF